jgi:RNA polymerase-binding protein
MAKHTAARFHMKGSRVGSSVRGLTAAAGEKRPHRPVASRLVSFWCRAGHTTIVRLLADIPPPPSWQCGRCGETASSDPAQPPPPTDRETVRGRTHLDLLHMRRTPEEGERALAEALDLLRARREAGEDL